MTSSGCRKLILRERKIPEKQLHASTLSLLQDFFCVEAPFFDWKRASLLTASVIASQARLPSGRRG
jgi:hypothetical protein